MERIARQNLEAELQRTLDKLSSSTALCNSLQQTELVYCLCLFNCSDCCIMYTEECTFGTLLYVILTLFCLFFSLSEHFLNKNARNSSLCVYVFYAVHVVNPMWIMFRTHNIISVIFT